ncbi:hypothetical protein A6X21_21195 [Planctopirus hydrillae]|uniref:Uncharacterized protein n=1 Tax=Planctopirus hydrillae TaxID=1841610 RepID=A0A1C3EGE5_9PLAN|nr:hypothetical protein A6X21_21195 [Planctopirus hydrillae]
MVGGEVFGRQAQLVVEDVGSRNFIMVEGPLEAVGNAGEDIQLEAIPQTPGLEALRPKSISSTPQTFIPVSKPPSAK